MRIIGKKATLYQWACCGVELQQCVNCWVLTPCYRIQNRVIAREEKSTRLCAKGSVMGIAFRVAQWTGCVLAAVLPAHVQSSPEFGNPESARPAVLLAQAGPAKTPPPAPAADMVPIEPVAPPKFEIRRYLLEGNTLLRRETIDRV